MNEQLAAALAEIISMVTAGAQAVYEFGAEQIPIVLQQLLLWHMVESLLFFSIGAVLFLFCTYCYYSVANGNRHRLAHIFADVREDGSVREVYPTITIPVMAHGVSGVMIFTNLTWLKIWLAPNLYLLEYAAKLVK